jgi:hypothetical protein
MLGMSPAGGAEAAGAETAGAYAYSDTFQSPSGNIRCGYVDQVGVGCYTRNNGRWAFLESFGESYLPCKAATFGP